jgi:hypothetical protein
MDQHLAPHAVDNKEIYFFSNSNGDHGTQKKELTDKGREHVLHLLLEARVDKQKLKHGAKTVIAKMMGVNAMTVSKIWKRAIESLARTGFYDVSAKKKVPLVESARIVQPLPVLVLVISPCCCA